MRTSGKTRLARTSSGYRTAKGYRTPQRDPKATARQQTRIAMRLRLKKVKSTSRDTRDTRDRDREGGLFGKGGHDAQRLPDGPNGRGLATDPAPALADLAEALPSMGRAVGLEGVGIATSDRGRTA